MAHQHKISLKWLPGPSPIITTILKYFYCQGYGDPIDNESCETEIPKELKGNRNVLFGNIEEIYAFHSKLFLKDLEECKNTPALVGKCFTNRVSAFWCVFFLFEKNLLVVIAEMGFTPLHSLQSSFV